MLRWFKNIAKKSKVADCSSEESELDEIAFAHFMSLCATAGTDPLKVQGADEKVLAKLQRHPNLQENGEILLWVSRKPVAAERVFLGTWLWMLWQKWRRWPVVDRIIQRHMQSLKVPVSYALAPCSGRDATVPNGVLVRKEGFKVMVIGLSYGDLKALARELGMRFGQTEVYLRRFNAGQWETVNIG